MYIQSNTAELIQQLSNGQVDGQASQELYCNILRSLTPAQRSQLGEIVVAKMIRASQVMNDEICQELLSLGLIQRMQAGPNLNDFFYVPTSTGEAALMSIYRHYHGRDPY